MLEPGPYLLGCSRCWRLPCCGPPPRPRGGRRRGSTNAARPSASHRRTGARRFRAPRRQPAGQARLQRRGVPRVVPGQGRAAPVAVRLRPGRGLPRPHPRRAAAGASTPPTRTQPGPAQGHRPGRRTAAARGSPRAPGSTACSATGSPGAARHTAGSGAVEAPRRPPGGTGLREARRDRPRSQVERRRSPTAPRPTSPPSATSAPTTTPSPRSSPLGAVRGLPAGRHGRRRLLPRQRRRRSACWCPSRPAQASSTPTSPRSTTSTARSSPSCAG